MKVMPCFAWAALVLAACDLVPRLSPDPALLAGRGAAAPTGPDCASCHAYPLHDVNHEFHLMTANVNRNNLGKPKLNGLTTCMDCHFNSVRRFGYVHSDTTWMDINGVELLEHTSPTDQVKSIARYSRWRPVPYGGVDTLRGEALAMEIDSAVFRGAARGTLVEWMTGHAHNDGKVDVAFAPNDVVGAAALDTAFRPRDLSCSAVACHSAKAIGYRFADPGLGLGNCPSMTGSDSTCRNEVVPDGEGG